MEKRVRRALNITYIFGASVFILAFILKEVMKFNSNPVDMLNTIGITMVLTSALISTIAKIPFFVSRNTKQ